jgi:hypothetical protein
MLIVSQGIDSDDLRIAIAIFRKHPKALVGECLYSAALILEWLDLFHTSSDWRIVSLPTSLYNKAYRHFWEMKQAKLLTDEIELAYLNSITSALERLYNENCTDCS